MTRWLAVLLGLAAVVEATAIASVGGEPGRFSVGVDLTSIGLIGSVVTFPLVGALVLSRRPRALVAWLMVVDGLALGLGILIYGWSLDQLPDVSALGGAAPQTSVAAWGVVVAHWFFMPTFGIGSVGLMLLYPTDRLISPGWRSALVVGGAGTVLFLVGATLHRGPLTLAAGVANPIGVDPSSWPLLDAVMAAGNGAIAVAFVIAATSLVVRYRRSDGVVRAQIRWIAYVAAPAAALLAFSVLALGPITDAAFGLGLTLFAALPLAIGVAVTRYHLYDIDWLINRTVVYGVLMAVLAGVFTAAIALAQRLFVAYTGQTSDAAIVGATLVVATCYAPIRKRLEAIVDRSFKYEQRRFGAYTAELRRTLSMIDLVHAASRLASEACRELDPVGAAVLDEHGMAVGTAGRWDPDAAATAVEVRIPGPGPFHTILLAPHPGRSNRPFEAATLARLAEAGSLANRTVRPAPEAI